MVIEVYSNHSAQQGKKLANLVFLGILRCVGRVMYCVHDHQYSVQDLQYHDGIHLRK